MADYLIIASDDPFESRRAERMREMAVALRRRGSSVSVYLAQNAVLGARRASRAATCDQLLAENIDVLADDFSLRERGITPGSLLPGVKVASLDAVIARLAHGWKTLWS